MILISNLVLEVLDGSTIASTEIYGTDKKTYINIGSGNVFKLRWETPELASGDAVDHYRLITKRHDTTINVYYDIFDKNIGLVNEFYVDSYMLPTLPEQYMLSIYLVAYGKNGSVLTSNVVNPYISKGSGTYVKVDAEGYSQPIMKRALAITKGLPVLADPDGSILEDAEGNILIAVGFTNEYALKDRNGIPITVAGVPIMAVATKVLVPINDWFVVQEVYTKDSDSWRINDIEFEVLVDENGEVIECLNNGSYEPLYVQ